MTQQANYITSWWSIAWVREGPGRFYTEYFQVYLLWHSAEPFPRWSAQNCRCQPWCMAGNGFYSGFHPGLLEPCNVLFPLWCSRERQLHLCHCMETLASYWIVDCYKVRNPVLHNHKKDNFLSPLTKLKKLFNNTIKISHLQPKFQLSLRCSNFLWKNLHDRNS